MKYLKAADKAFKTIAANNPIKLLKDASSNRQMPFIMSDVYHIKVNRENIHRIYYSSTTGWIRTTLNKETITDDAAIFLQGVTALTVNIESWQMLARAHRKNQQETVIMTFVKKKASRIS